jgi:hypothetical protein
MRLVVLLIMQEQGMSCMHASARVLWGCKVRQSVNPLSKDFCKWLRGIAKSSLYGMAGCFAEMPGRGVE